MPQARSPHRPCALKRKGQTPFSPELNKIETPNNAQPHAKSENTIKNVVLGDNVYPAVKVLQPAVVLFFACTFEKSQGKTLLYVILALHINMWCAISLRDASIAVAVTSTTS